MKFTAMLTAGILLSASGAHSSPAQSVYTIARGGVAIARETVSSNDDSSHSVVVVGKGDMEIQGSIVRTGGRVTRYDAKVSYRNDPSHDQQLHVAFDSSVATAVFHVNGAYRTASIPFDAKRPLMIFENLMFGLVGTSLPKVPVGETETVQVLVPQLRAVQLWHLSRTSDSTYVLTTLDNLAMEWTLSGRHMGQFRVSAQSLLEQEVSADSSGGVK